MAADDNVAIRYESYHGEEQLPLIMTLIDHELSEPYSIFTYRYFITLWPQLCFMAFHEDTCVGTIVCKMGQHRNIFRGYIAMLVVVKPFRGKGIATELVTRAIQVMRDAGCEEVTLEAEVTNKGALALYGNLGFTRAKRLHKYYLNGLDAFRLKLLFPLAYDQDSIPVSDHGSDHDRHGLLHHHFNDEHNHGSCNHHHHNHPHGHHHHFHNDGRSHSDCDHYHEPHNDDHNHGGCVGHGFAEQQGRFSVCGNHSHPRGHTCAHH